LSAALFASISFLAQTFRITRLPAKPGFPSTSAPNTEGEKSGPSWMTTRRLAVTLFACGFLGIGYEILGVRLLAQRLQTPIYTYATALIVFLAGTAIGAIASQSAYARSIPGGVGIGRRISFLLVALAIAVGIGGWTLVVSPGFYLYLRTHLGDSQWGVFVAELLVATAVF